VLTAVEDVCVGHWSDETARTGCTVVLFPEGTTASAEVRGGAPATRELALLDPQRMVRRIDAALLTGGSAFGLAAADGVMRFCEEHGRGVPTSAGVVPIVPALALYDLATGTPGRPGPAAGYAACQAASSAPVDLGPVGVGTGAMVDRWLGPERVRAGGLCGAAVEHGDLVVAALLALNAYGTVDTDGTGLDRAVERVAKGDACLRGSSLEATTIGVLATNARLDKIGCLVLAQGGHDGLARSVVPAHTRFDGDAFIAAATGRVEAPIDLVRLLGMAAVERAIRSLATGQGDHL
jgi:L-aminopeptidase/D-esterase-like protein